ncbi:hypothetical protein KP79_PYT05916 [Mizuhopecten yessoensis]|uniref:Methyltransferase FkbM domain-containing protein n=1 Tax=Mizuhopecten yessoensis TaxID=6573 RepID=A0A210PUF6_MIZYE|nr:hypothetical protein KP79_PYT05916 [Mizuhopecten yessoensis]
MPFGTILSKTKLIQHHTMKICVLHPWRYKVRCMKRIGLLFLGSFVVFLISREYIETLPSEPVLYQKNDFLFMKQWSNISPSPKLPTVKYQHVGTLLQYNNKIWTEQPQNCYLKPGIYPEGILKNSSNITVYVYNPEEDKWISESILSHGEWKGNLSLQINQMLLQDKRRVFIDIGAHLGVFSIPAAFTGTHVIAIDCVKESLKRLCASVKRNKLLDRVTLIHNAVWRDNRYATLKVSPKNAGGVKVETVHEVRKPRGKTREMVPTITLDNLLEMFNFSNVVIKMSVEGDELTILQGAKRFFSIVRVDYLIIEFTNHRRKLSALQMRSLLHSYGMEPMVSDAMLKEKTYVRWPSTVVWRRI